MSLAADFGKAFQGGMGFAHAAAFCSVGLSARHFCQVAASAESLLPSVSGSCPILDINFLNTAACIIQSLRATGFDLESERISGCIVEELHTTSQSRTANTPTLNCSSYSPTFRLLSEISLEIRLLTVWGGDQIGLLQPLIVLLNALSLDKWTWDAGTCCDLSYCLSLVSPVPKCVDTVTLVAPPRVLLAIVCVLAPVRNSSVTVEVHFPLMLLLTGLGRFILCVDLD